MRPFAVFTLLAGLWVTLSIGLQPLAERLWGVQATGLGLRHVDALSAVGFALFGGRLLVRRRRSHWVPLALTATLFLDAGYVLEQMLQAHVAVAELYVVLQAAGFLLVRQVAERRSFGWRRLAPWLVVAAVFLLSRLHGGLADALGQFVQTDVIAAAIIWDLLMSEERLGARRPGGSLSRPGRLLLYLGYVTWSVAQLVYAGTGAGTEALALEPVLALGFVVFGMPRVLHGFLAHLRSGGATHAPAAEGA
ncbi:MAG TPA: hypothetical protein VFK80_11465 [Limnochordia bacterium]|nr:hypothetical protein [Limnochordia bacterium]